MRVEARANAKRKKDLRQQDGSLANLVNVEEGLVSPRIFVDPEPRVQQGDIVANKRLGAVLTQIQADQQERDRQRLASRDLTLREKARIRAAQEEADAAIPS